MDRITAILLAAWVLIYSNSSAAQTVGLDRVIAVVNDDAITFSEYQTKLELEQLSGKPVPSTALSTVDRAILESMVEERLQAQMADARGIVVSEAEIDSVVNNMAARNNISVSSLYAQLDSNGISVREFRASLDEQLKISKVVDAAVNSRLNITEQEVDYHLQSHRELYQTEESYEISHLFVSTRGLDEDGMVRERENVKSIQSALEQGIEFSKAVADFSDGENADNGGYIGWRRDDQLPDIFVSALRETSVGGVTEIIESDNGYHLLKLHAKEGDQQIVTQHFTRHILIQPRRRGITDADAMELMQEILDELAEGEDFAALARLHSDDESSGSAGGELGWVNPGDTAAGFEQIMRDIELNTVSEPVRTQFGLHILEVTDRRKRDISQDLARKEAYAEIYRRKSNEMFKIWFSRLREGAYIEYLAGG